MGVVSNREVVEGKTCTGDKAKANNIHSNRAHLTE